MNLAEILWRAQERFPERCAVWEDGCEINFRELLGGVGRAVKLLRGLGLEQGDRVALLLSNCTTFVVMHYAALWLGAVVVPLNPNLRGESLHNMLAQAEPVSIVCREEEARFVLDFRAGQTTPRAIVVVDTAFGIPERVRLWTGTGDGRGSQVELSTSGSDIGEPLYTNEDVPAVFFMTSGTTGRPKGILLSHGQALFGADAWVECWGFNEKTISLMAAPFSHVVYNPLVLGAHRRGGCAAITNALSSRSVTRAVEQARVTAMMGTPSLFIQLLQDNACLVRDLSSIQSIIYGAAPTPVPVIQRLTAQFPAAKLYNCYGLTETSSALTCLRPEHLPGREASVGLCHSGIEITIRDDHRRELSTGELGEIYCRGPNVISSYYGAGESYAARFYEGWLRTGDAGYQDKEGYLYLVGRTDDQINVSGEKIYPAEIENVLYRHPAVSDAAVVGITDPTRGRIIKAVVVNNQGQQLDPAELRRFCSSHLPAALVPKVIEQVQQLPRNNSGKVLRGHLR